VDTLGLVLAAGAGTRLGGPKALVTWDGRSFLDRAVRLLRDGGCAEVAVVVGAQAQRVSAEARQVGGIAVEAAGWQSGMAASLRAALGYAATTAYGSCVVALVDQPRLGAASVTRLIAATGPAAVAAYGGVPGHPVRLDREVWDEVAATATGDRGARTWLRANPGRVTVVPCDGTGSPDDVDTVADLARLEREG
jgi:CTP:molybdopterin cytidylyltransferase MocA